MKNKKMCFVIHSLGYGGAKKSLVNLINNIDVNIDVDVYLIHDLVTEDTVFCRKVNIVKPNRRMMFINNFKKPKKFIRYFSPIVFIRMIPVFLLFLYYKISNRKCSQYYKDQIKWKLVWKKSIKKIKTEYDLVVGYMDGLSSYFSIDCLNGKKHILWSHHEYQDLKTNPKIDKTFFAKADFIVFVSEYCRLEFLKTFDTIPSSKTIVLPNIVNYSDLFAKSEAYFPKEYENVAPDCCKILSVGRLSPVKHFDLIVDVCLKLSIPYIWIIVGDGPEFCKLNNLICEHGLQERIKLVGSKDNPYPYFKNSNIFVQTSYSEAKSIVIDEAKIFGLPIVCSNYFSAKEAAKDYACFSICNSVVEFADAITNNHSSYKLLCKSRHIKNEITLNFINDIINKV